MPLSLPVKPLQKLLPLQRKLQAMLPRLHPMR
jgi:hypothetical protein